jgi:predicted  nucleic acid-binding Zn-ribbon protein
VDVGIVDPGPLIEERLAELASQYEPQLAAARTDLARATSRKDRRDLQREIRRIEREYGSASAEVHRLETLGW